MTETQQSILVSSKHKNECEPLYSLEPKHYMNMSHNNINQESEMQFHEYKQYLEYEPESPSISGYAVVAVYVSLWAYGVRGNVKYVSSCHPKSHGLVV